jgi:hypothetical protein
MVYVIKDSSEYLTVGAGGLHLEICRICRKTSWVGGDGVVLKLLFPLLLPLSMKLNWRNHAELSSQVLQQAQTSLHESLLLEEGLTEAIDEGPHWST